MKKGPLADFVCQLKARVLRARTRVEGSVLLVMLSRLFKLDLRTRTGNFHCTHRAWDERSEPMSQVQKLRFSLSMSLSVPNVCDTMTEVEGWGSSSARSLVFVWLVAQT